MKPWKYILNERREPVPTDDLMGWARWIEANGRRVALTALPSGHVVSTVFLGLNHQFGDGPPLLFETMVAGDGDFLGLQRRCSTWAQAEAQHEAVVLELTAQFTEMDRRFRERH
jgi:hypothetical protein